VGRGRSDLSGASNRAEVVSTHVRGAATKNHFKSIALILMALAGNAAIPAADASARPDLAWKLTLGQYVYAGYAGSDLNLRWRRDETSSWVGIYTDRIFGTQARAGADTSIDVGPYLKVQPSFQLASRGFVGGSLTLQVGGAWYAITGLGRTDTRPYFNLNFDPNDALTLGAGHVAANGASYSVFIVADNRFHTEQRDWHANVQIPFGNSHATLDLLRKSGLSDSGYITGWGFSTSWDWPTWFLRLAYDPHQNFSVENAWRFAGGVRF
jgi:hypothetical protein